MKNNFLVIFLISIVVYGCNSSDLSDGGSLNYKKYESKEIKCGKKRIKILSSCYDSEEDLLIEVVEESLDNVKVVNC